VFSPYPSDKCSFLYKKQNEWFPNRPYLYRLKTKVSSKFLKKWNIFLAGKFDLKVDFPGRGRKPDDTASEKMQGIERHDSNQIQK